MSDYIPHELLVDILVRLPVASLLRFKAVCKAWNSLITNPSFVTEHLNHSKTNCQKILLGVFTEFEGENEREYLLCRDNEQFGDESSESKFPFVDVPLDHPPFEHFDIVGILNGILCLRLYFPLETSIILWNPSTRKSVIVPKHEGWCLGFGLQPATHEYKLLMMNDWVPRLGIDRKVDIYTQATGWRTIGLGSTFPYHLVLVRDQPQVFVNGAINWIASHQLVSGCQCNLIVAFDMSAETFDVLTLPPTLANEQNELNVKIFQGSLSVLCHRHLTNTSACYMWVMKEYGVPESWTYVFSFELGVPLYSEGSFVFRKHSEVLLQACGESGDQLLSYDFGTKALTDTGIRGAASTYTYLYVEHFVETLVSLGNQNRVLDDR